MKQWQKNSQHAFMLLLFYREDWKTENSTDH